MNTDSVFIRVATAQDAPDILAIYAPYVQNTAITFEYDVPSLEEFRGRIERTLTRYPYIVAVCDGKIAGYAYTSAFHSRAAYTRSAETTVYVKENMRKTGLGKILYLTLEKISRKQNILNLNACVAYPDTEDEYLTMNSVHFHEHMGYSLAGVIHNCAYKFGRWYNTSWMEKMIGEHSPEPAAFIPFPELGEEVL